MAKKTRGELILADGGKTASFAAVALDHLGMSTFSAEGAVAIAKQALADHQAAGFRLGFALLALKSECAHGEYQDALGRIGLSDRTARYYAGTARWALESGAIKHLAGLNTHALDSARKALARTGVSLDEIVDDDGRIAGLHVDELKEMTAEEVGSALETIAGQLADTEDKLADKDREIAKLKAQKETAQAEARNLKKSGARRLDMPEWMQSARHEATVLLEQMTLGLEHLAKVAAEQLEPHANADDEEERRLADVSAGTLRYGLAAVTRRAVELQQYLDDLFPEQARGLQAAHALSAEEQAIADHAIKTILRRHEAQVLNRDTERKLARQRAEPSPGRPPKFVAEE